MTLYRQLLIFTLILFTLLFVGIWVEKLHSTRSFLLTQLESHAQDTATSLGLSLSPVMAEGDIPTVDTMINAVFDRGYYRVISLHDIEGELITERVLQVEFEGVPDWFVQNILIESPSAESLVMAGWSQAGKLYVESHPGYAYQTMWKTMMRVSIYFLIAGSAVLIFGGLGLRLLLKPLKRVELQAEAICKKEYQIQETLPKTKELRQVVESMNRMTNQVREMFTGQSKIAEHLRQKAYKDQLTGLGNRRYIQNQVEARLEAAKEAVHGALLLLQIDNLKTINERAGFATGDELLVKVANIIKEETDGIDNVILARLTGGDFALFIPGISSGDAIDIANILCLKVSRLTITNISQTDNIFHLGGITYEEAQPLSQLLSEADNALQAARRKGSNRYHITALDSTEDTTIKGKTWWKETLDTILSNDEVLLFHQPVMSSRDQRQVVHQELLSRIAMQSGEIVSAGIFVPLAERLQLSSTLDKVVLNKIFRERKNLSSFNSIAVNVSPSSLKDQSFTEWILSELRKLPQNHPNVIFEFSEFGAVQYLECVKEFTNSVQEMGHGIGLDHFGQSFANFGYLQSLRPEYVKIDRAFTKELEENHGDSEFFIEALCGVAHSLDIRVIAEGIEREDQLQRLLELKIDALQGYLFGEPKQVQL